MTLTLTLDAPIVQESKESALTLGRFSNLYYRTADPFDDFYALTNFFPRRGSMQTTLVGSAERTRLLDQAMAKVREYRSLPENWDSYGGKRASDKAVNYATSLLACLYNDPEVYAPFVSPISNGVHLEWKYGEKDLYFEIDQTSVLIVARDSGQIVCSAEDPGFDVASAIDVTKYFHQSVK